MSEQTDAELVTAVAEYLESTAVLAAAEVDEHGTIARANAALERLAGRSLAGSPVRELVRAEQQPALAALLAPSGAGWRRQTLGLCPDVRGIPHDFAVSCRAHGSRRLLVAEPLAATVAAVDEQLLALNDELAAAQRRIDRQNAELARRNVRLEELDRLKDVLLANVSHDLRTPLTAILGYAELLRRRGLNAMQTQAVDVIERNARRLLRLVSDLLVLAETRAGGIVLQRERVDLAALAADEVELAQPLAEQAELSLRLEAETAVVEADALRLAQLLDNLLANAIKFTPAGGTVTVRVRGGAGAATLAVDDTGPGIPEGERESIFAPFERGEAGGSTGTGLGLAIARAIAEAHGATIEAGSAPSGGARFTVGFPGENR